MSKVNNGMMSNNTDVWGTPKALFAKLHKEFSFTLDACANKDNAKCAKYFDEAKDGLKQKWTGTVWCNPPYSKNALWFQKAYEEVQNGNADTVVMLVPNRGDTAYFHDYGMKADEIRLIRGRLKFEDPQGNAQGSAPFPSCIIIFRKNKKYDELKVISYSRD